MDHAAFLPDIPPLPLSFSNAATSNPASASTSSRGGSLSLHAWHTSNTHCTACPPPHRLPRRATGSARFHRRETPRLLCVCTPLPTARVLKLPGVRPGRFGIEVAGLQRLEPQLVRSNPMASTAQQFSDSFTVYRVPLLNLTAFRSVSISCCLRSNSVRSENRITTNHSSEAVEPDGENTLGGYVAHGIRPRLGVLTTRRRPPRVPPHRNPRWC